MIDVVLVRRTLSRLSIKTAFGMPHFLIVPFLLFHLLPEELLVFDKTKSLKLP